MSRTALWPRWPSLLLFALAIGLLAISAQVAVGQDAESSEQTDVLKQRDAAAVQELVENSVDRTITPPSSAARVVPQPQTARDSQALIATPWAAPAQSSSTIDLQQLTQRQSWLPTWRARPQTPFWGFNVAACNVTPCGSNCVPCKVDAVVGAGTCKCGAACGCGSPSFIRTNACSCGSTCKCASPLPPATAAAPQTGPYDTTAAATTSQDELLETVKENTALKAQQEVRDEYTDSLLQALVENAKLKAQAEFAAEKEEFYESAIEILVENASLKARAEFAEQQQETYRQFIASQQQHTEVLTRMAAENAKLHAQLELVAGQKDALGQFASTQKGYAKQVQELQALLQAAQQQIQHADGVRRENVYLKERLAELDKKLKEATQTTVQPITPAGAYSQPETSGYQRTVPDAKPRY